MAANSLVTRRWTLMFWLALLAFLLVAIHLLSGILLPFVAAFGIAYFLAPLVDRLERARLSRTLATLVVLLLFVLALALMVMLILPLMRCRFRSSSRLAPTALDQGRQQVQQLMKMAQERLSTEDAARLRDMAGSWASAALGWAAKLAEEILIQRHGARQSPVADLHHAPGGVLPAARLGQGGLPSRKLAAAPSCRHRAPGRCAEINATLAGFLRGQMMVGLILAIYYAVALSVAGTQFRHRHRRPDRHPVLHPDGRRGHRLGAGAGHHPGPDPDLDRRRDRGRPSSRSGRRWRAAFCRRSWSAGGSISTRSG